MKNRSLTTGDLPWEFKIVDVPISLMPELYHCRKCGYGFSNVSRPVKPAKCPACGRTDWNNKPERNGTI